MTQATSTHSGAPAADTLAADASTTLRHELLALAMLADIQAQPEHAGAIALEFDHWCLSILSTFQGALTVRQRALLNALDAYFDELSRQEDEAVWSEAAIRHGHEWADIRSLARQALESFGWRGQHTLCEGDGLMVTG